MPGNALHRSKEDLLGLAEDIRKLRELRDQIVSGRHAFYKASDAAYLLESQRDKGSTTLLHRISPKLSETTQQEGATHAQIRSPSCTTSMTDSARLTVKRKSKPSSSRGGASDHASSRLPTDSAPISSVKHAKKAPISPEVIPALRRSSLPYHPALGEETRNNRNNLNTAHHLQSGSDRDAERVPSSEQYSAAVIMPTSKRQRELSPLPRQRDHHGDKQHQPDRSIKQRRSPSPCDQTCAPDGTTLPRPRQKSPAPLAMRVGAPPGLSVRISKNRRGSQSRVHTAPSHAFEAYNSQDRPGAGNGQPIHSTISGRISTDSSKGFSGQSAVPNSGSCRIVDNRTIQRDDRPPFSGPQVLTCDSLSASSQPAVGANTRPLRGGSLGNDAFDTHSTNVIQHPNSATIAQRTGSGQGYPVAGPHTPWRPLFGWHPYLQDTQEPSAWQSRVNSEVAPSANNGDMQQTAYGYPVPVLNQCDGSGLAQQQQPFTRYAQQFGQTPWSAYNASHQGSSK